MANLISHLSREDIGDLLGVGHFDDNDRERRVLLAHGLVMQERHQDVKTGSQSEGKVNFRDVNKFNRKN